MGTVAVTGKPGELPPRARRIPPATRPPNFPTGTTSACAENTFISGGAGGGSGNYLRVRGEYVREKPVLPKNWELPPRARRIPGFQVASIRTLGTTSACAENTGEVVMFGGRNRNYLRVRGEYTGADYVNARI